MTLTRSPVIQNPHSLGIEVAPQLQTQTLTNGEPTVLVVSASISHRNQLGELFSDEGFASREADSPSAAERAARLMPVDLIVLDGRLGEGGSVAACGRLASSQSAPIIIVSEAADVTDRIIALEVGADDLIARPFDRRELVARARALLRRSRRPEPAVSRPGGPKHGVLHLESRMLVGPTGARVLLAPGTAAILQVFLLRPGELVTAGVVADVLGMRDLPLPHFRTKVARLRKRLEAAGFDSNCLPSIRCEGYSLDPHLQIETLTVSGAMPNRPTI